MQKIVDTWITSGIRSAQYKKRIEKRFSESRIKEALLRNRTIQPDEMSQLNDIDTEYIENELASKRRDVKFRVKTKINIGQNELQELSSLRFVAYAMIIKKASNVSVINSVDMLGDKLSNLCIDYGCQIGINAGGFKRSEEFIQPAGIIIKDSCVICNTGESDYKYNIIGLDEQDKLILRKMTTVETAEYKIRDAVDFGPHLIVDGINSIILGNGGWGLGPRTGIGQTEDGKIIFLVIEGRSLTSLGATMRDMQRIFNYYKAVNAANLDGGASSTMCAYEQLVNVPSDGGNERRLLSAFGYKDKVTNG